MKYKIFDEIVIQVSEITTAEHSEIFSIKREQALVDSRFFIVYIATKLDMSPSYNKRFFKLHGYDLHYAMIRYAKAVIKKRLKKDDYLKEKLNDIIHNFKILEND